MTALQPDDTLCRRATADRAVLAVCERMGDPFTVGDLVDHLPAPRGFGAGGTYHRQLISEALSRLTRIHKQLVRVGYGTYQEAFDRPPMPDIPAPKKRAEDKPPTAAALKAAAVAAKQRAAARRVAQAIDNWHRRI